jgi:hypothetical protein
LSGNRIPFEINEKPDVAVFTITGQLADAAECTRLTDSLKQYLPDKKKVQVDLTNAKSVGQYGQMILHLARERGAELIDPKKLMPDPKKTSLFRK